MIQRRCAMTVLALLLLAILAIVTVPGEIHAVQDFNVLEGPT